MVLTWHFDTVKHDSGVMAVVEDIEDHLQETGAQVPPLVCKCVHNIDSNGGIKVKGKKAVNTNVLGKD